MAQRSENSYRVRFLPIDRVYLLSQGESLLEAAMAAGVHVNAGCGGNGSCGKCRIKVLEGEVNAPAHVKIAQWEYDAGIRLACTSRPLTDVVIEVPLESQIDREALKKKREAPHILAAADIDSLVRGWEVNPAVFKRYIELPPPSAEDNINDLDRLNRALRKKYNLEASSVDFKVLTTLSQVLRDAQWGVTVTIVTTRKGHKLIDVQPGNREMQNYSVVIDIGTTTVCGQLLDLANCSVYRKIEKDNGTELCTLAESIDYNAQISYGEDVISRMMYAQKEGGLKRLQEVVVGTINRLIKELVEISGVDRMDISHLVFAGNTVMTHLVLGLDPRCIMKTPYTPTAAFIPPVRAINLGVEVNDRVYAYIFPSVASYVGGDIVAGILGSGVFQREEVTLFMDIGTNGEIVIGNKDWLTCTSCSAGPAFEGGGIKFGTRAGRGAIEQVRINPTTFEPMILTIGRTKPMGICGSGLIDAVAELLEAGIIDQNGTFKRELPTRRIREGESGWEYVLVYAPDTQIGRDIVLTEVDLDNLMRAKAALYAGCRVLLRNVGLTFEGLDRIIVAGGFGHYIDVEKAKMIGLLPDIDSDKFLFVGNGSLLGARLLSFSQELLRETERIARMMTNVELSNSTTFMDEFIAALFLPHTDESAFPSVMEHLRDRKTGEAANA
jgi:uncharacterized 2Fe-2S/4Fe-4S cluster protein (DUF4445 family)